MLVSVSRPSHVNAVGDQYEAVSSVIQSEITKYLTGQSIDADTALKTIQCKLQYLLYSSSSLQSVGCGDVVEVARALLVMCYIMALALIAVCTMLVVVIVIHYDHPAISSTSVTFSILLNVGAVCMCLAVICCTINPFEYRWSCVMQHMFYNLGFCLMFGSMFCSYKRCAACSLQCHGLTSLMFLVACALY